jgi:hypothetical protein
LCGLVAYGAMASLYTVYTVRLLSINTGLCGLVAYGAMASLYTVYTVRLLSMNTGQWHPSTQSTLSGCYLSTRDSIHLRIMIGLLQVESLEKT